MSRCFHLKFIIFVRCEITSIWALYCNKSHLTKTHNSSICKKWRNCVHLGCVLYQTQYYFATYIHDASNFENGYQHLCRVWNCLYTDYVLHQTQYYLLIYPWFLHLWKMSCVLGAPGLSLGKGLYAAKVTMGKLHKLYFEIPPTDLFLNLKVLCHLYGKKRWDDEVLGCRPWFPTLSIHSMYCIKPNTTLLLISMMPAITKYGYQHLCKMRNCLCLDHVLCQTQYYLLIYPWFLHLRKMSCFFVLPSFRWAKADMLQKLLWVNYISCILKFHPLISFKILKFCVIYMVKKMVWWGGTSWFPTLSLFIPCTVSNPILLRYYYPWCQQLRKCIAFCKIPSFNLKKAHHVVEDAMDELVILSHAEVQFCAVLKVPDYCWTNFSWERTGLLLSLWQFLSF